MTVTKSVVEIYDPNTLEVKSTITVSGSVQSVMKFIKEIRDVFYPDCLIREIDNDDPQMELL